MSAATRKYDKLYYANNREARRAYSAKYRLEHPAESERTHQYYLDHKEKICAYKKVYNRKNREKINAAHKVWYQENKESHMVVQMAYERAHPVQYMIYKQRHYAKKRGIAFVITPEEWIEWWGDELPLRGNKPYDLCMGRYDDRGPYKLGNIYKATNAENNVGPRPLPVPDF